jgi:uncharacterized membrane protein YfcA
MEYVIVPLVSLLVAALTLFSDFGLGTLLMPAFALFFPLPVAVAATAIVHLANNLFKVGLVGRKANWSVIVRFAFPGALATMVGAALLTQLDSVPPLATYELAGRTHQITLVRAVIAPVIVAFALMELVPRFKRIAFDREYLPIGGLLSGFFGGLSGNQGALRSAFLIRAGLSKEAFVGTNVVSAVIVDVFRLAVYGLAFILTPATGLGSDVRGPVILATAAAFAGSFLGARYLKKMTIDAIQVIVGVMLILVGLGLGTGLL